MIVVHCYENPFGIDGFPDEVALLEWFAERGFAASVVDSCPSPHQFSLRQTDAFFDLLFQERVLLGGQSLSLILEFLVAKIHGLISYHTPDLVFMRGEAVVTEEGTALLLVGPSLSGKSTLAQALLAGSMTQLSSFYAVLDREGRALPYPREVVSKESVPVSLVALLVYDPEASWNTRSASPGEMALRLTAYLEGPEDSVASSLKPIARLSLSCRERLLGTRGECLDTFLSGLSRSTPRGAD